MYPVLTSRVSKIKTFQAKETPTGLRSVASLVWFYLLFMQVYTSAPEAFGSSYLILTPSKKSYHLVNPGQQQKLYLITLGHSHKATECSNNAVKRETKEEA